MNFSPEDDLISLNFYYKNKLKKSITYLIYSGYFDKIRELIEKSKNQKNNDDEDYNVNSLANDQVNLNETDEWWIDLPSSITKKNVSPTNRFLSTMSAPPMLPSRSQQKSTSSIAHVRQSLNEQALFNKSRKTKGRTPLMLCSIIEDDSWAYGIAQNLIEKGAKLGLKDSNGHNALMYACLYERSNILELFLNAPGDYDLLAKDRYGNTAFHLASIGKTQHNCFILFKLALKFNIDPYTKIGKNYFGHTPFDICKLNNHESCLRNLYKIRKGILTNKDDKIYRSFYKPQYKVQISAMPNHDTENMDLESEVDNNYQVLDRRKSEIIRRHHNKEAVARSMSIANVTRVSADLKHHSINKSSLDDHNFKLETSIMNFDMQKNLSNDKHFLMSSVHFDKPVHISSTDTLSSGSETMENYVDTNKSYLTVLTSRSNTTTINYNYAKSSLKCYRYILSGKEPLIKIKSFCLFQNKKQEKAVENLFESSSSNFSSTSHSNKNKEEHKQTQEGNQNKKRCRVTRLVNLPNYSAEPNKSHYLINQEANSQISNTSSLNMLKNVKSMFDTMEYQKSKSYRRTNKNSVLLFETLTKQFLLNLQKNEALMNSNSNSRRNSVLYRGGSSMSIRSGDKHNKSNKSQRRQSVISVK